MLDQVRQVNMGAAAGRAHRNYKMFDRALNCESDQMPCPFHPAAISKMVGVDEMPYGRFRVRF